MILNLISTFIFLNLLELIKLENSNVAIKIELISRRLGYCVDNEISLCMTGDFINNITESLIRKDDKLRQSIDQFCSHIQFGFECLIEYTEKMCSRNNHIKDLIVKNIKPFLDLHADICEKNYISEEMESIFKTKNCIQYDLLINCFTKYYSNWNYYIHQDSNNRLFCANLIHTCKNCFLQAFDGCSKSTKLAKNKLVKNLILKYSICSPSFDEELEYDFPSKSKSLSIKINLYLFYTFIILTIYYINK